MVNFCDFKKMVRYIISFDVFSLSYDTLEKRPEGSAMP